MSSRDRWLLYADQIKKKLHYWEIRECIFIDIMVAIEVPVKQGVTAVNINIVTITTTTTKDTRQTDTSSGHKPKCMILVPR